MLAAPLPRAWQWLDGSAFDSHGQLMAKLFGIEAMHSRRPLMYQGMSHRFLGPRDDVPLPLEAHGIDFEGEFGVITDEVPMGVTPQAAVAEFEAGRCFLLPPTWTQLDSLIGRSVADVLAVERQIVTVQPNLEIDGDNWIFEFFDSDRYHRARKAGGLGWRH